MKTISNIQEVLFSSKNPILKTILLFLLGFFIFTALPAWAGINQWTSNGPYGGFIEALAISPNYANDQTVFAGNLDGKVYKSTDGGATWTGVDLGISYQYVYSIAISPNYATDHTVFAGGNQGGVYKSTDGGASWTSVNLPPSSVAISPNYVTDHTVFAGGQGGVYKSTDGGASWTVVNSTIGSVAISPNYAMDHTVFASNSLGVNKSTDGGANWAVVTTTVGSVTISPNYATDHTVFGNGNSQEGLYKSTDGGASWTLVTTTVGFVTISPNYAMDHTVFGSGNQEGFYKSTDGGASWNAVDSGIPFPYIGTVAISPDYATDHTVFAGSDGAGVYKSTDGGASWTWATSGISNVYIGTVAISPNYATDHTVFAGSDGDVYKSTNGGASWNVFNLGTWFRPYVYCIAISPNYVTDQTVFAGTDLGGIYKSTDGGATWASVDAGIAFQPYSSYYTYIYSIAISPNYAIDQAVFAGSSEGGVYKSTDGGTSWTAVNSGLPFLNGASSIYNINSVAISPNYAIDHTVFAGSSVGGVYKSTDGGASWTVVNSGMAIPYAESVAISPNYATDRTVFAGNNNTNGIFAGDLYKSTDGGANWTKVTSGMSNTMIDSIAISPSYATDQTVFAGSNGGLYKSTNGGANWTAVNSGIPNLAIKSMAIPPTYAMDHTVFAAMGNSVFSYTAGSATAPGAPIGVTALPGLAQATVGFTGPASDGGSAITSYTVTSSPGGIIASGASSPITVSGLTSGITYTFTVTATNAIGTGPASTPSNAVVIPSITPTAGAGFAASIVDDLQQLAGGNPWQSIALDLSNKAHIAYISYAANAYVMKYATNSSGSWVNTTIGSPSPALVSPSIAVDTNGKVHISYAGDPTGYNLMYATNVTGSWVTSVIETGGMYGIYETSIAVDSNNKVHIAYMKLSDVNIAGTLKYATNASGIWQVVTIDSTGDADKSPSIAVDSNGKVHISYVQGTWDGTTWTHYNRYATNESGLWVTSAIDSTGYSGLYAANSIAIDSHNNAHISYIGNNDLRYATNSSGAWVSSVLDTNAGASSISIDSNGKVHISYISGGLKYITNVYGAWASYLVDSMADDSSIAIGSDGSIQISYIRRYPSFPFPILMYAFNSTTPAVDTTPPTTTAYPSGGTYSSAQNVTLTCNDGGGSGCKTTYYCLGSGCNPTTVYYGYYDSINVSSSTDLRFYSIDNANKSESVKTETYTITTTPQVTHIITASAGANGSLTPSGALTVNHNATQSFTITHDSGYLAVVSGTCGGNLVSTAYTTNPITADCSVTANFNPIGSSQELLPGNNVQVSVPVSLPSGGSATVTLTFTEITSGGDLIITTTKTPPSGQPSGFKFLGTYYDISFTGSFSGYIYITLPYNGSSIPSGKEATLKLFHWKNNGWEDCTYSLDTANNKITGRVTSLSPFGFGYPFSSGSGSGSSSYKTGANENMIALIAILAISAGVFLLRRKRRWN
jgi:LPXTG-motif cell wall-anchored protein